MDPLVRGLKLDLGPTSPGDVNAISYTSPMFGFMVNMLCTHLTKWPLLRQIIHSGVLYQEFLKEIVVKVYRQTCRLESITLRDSSDYQPRDQTMGFLS